MNKKLIIFTVGLLLAQTTPTYTVVIGEGSKDADSNTEQATPPDTQPTEKQIAKAEKEKPVFDSDIDWDATKATYVIPPKHVPKQAWLKTNPAATLKLIKDLKKEDIPQSDVVSNTHAVNNAIRDIIGELNSNLEKYPLSPEDICKYANGLIRQMIELATTGKELGIIDTRVIDNTLAWAADHREHVKELKAKHKESIQQYLDGLDLAKLEMQLGRRNNIHDAITQLQKLNPASVKIKRTEFEGEINGMLTLLTREIYECPDVDQATNLIDDIQTIIIAADGHDLPVGQHQMQDARACIKQKDREIAMELRKKTLKAIALRKRNKAVRKELYTSEHARYKVDNEEEELSDIEYDNDPKAIRHIFKELPPLLEKRNKPAALEQSQE